MDKKIEKMIIIVSGKFSTTKLTWTKRQKKGNNYVEKVIIVVSD